MNSGKTLKVIMILAFVTVGCLAVPNSELITNTPAQELPGTSVPPLTLSSPTLVLPTSTPIPPLPPAPTAVPHTSTDVPTSTPELPEAPQATPSPSPTPELPEAPGPGGDVADVTPQFGPVGTTYLITFKEFAPNSVVVISIISEATQKEIFKVETLTGAQGNGAVQYTTQSGDAVGTYIVWVKGTDVNGHDKVAKGRFAITAG